jgi:hypothetical protein
MKTLTSRILSLFGIALLAAAMVFFFAACPQESEPDKPEIPKDLQDTEWINTAGDKISFDKDSVTITPDGEQSWTFKLKGSQYVDEIKQTTLFFKDKKSVDNIITYKNGKITMVNFSIIDNLNRANGWGSSLPTDFRYQLYDNYCAIVGYKGDGGNVIIPSKYVDKPVREIFNSAFESKNLTSVTIPDSINLIFVDAFTSNYNLTSITIGANVRLASDNYDYARVFDNNFDTIYRNNNKAKGTYTRTVGSDNWIKVK